MLIKNMSEEEKEEYFNRFDEDGFEVHLRDILYRTIHITEVPYEYRTTGNAYIYAMRAALENSLPAHIRLIELKIVDQMLLSDIAQMRAEHRTGDADWFAMMYWSHFPTLYDRCKDD